MALSRAQIQQALAKTQLFAGLSEQEISNLSNLANSRHHSAGELLFGEGDPCSGLYVIIGGKVKIFKTSPAGREQVLGLEGPGSSIAELPVFDGGKYPATAVAAIDTETLFLSRENFTRYCLQHPEVALKIIKVVGSRLRRLLGIIEELSFTTVRDRLIAFLLRASRNEGTKTDRGIQFNMGLNQQELAAYIGTVRELVSRNLHRLEAEGLIEMDGRQVLIPDVKALEAAQTAD